MTYTTDGGLFSRERDQPTYFYLSGDKKGKNEVPFRRKSLTERTNLTLPPKPIDLRLQGLCHERLRWGKLGQKIKSWGGGIPVE